jgi:hypothetical protein
MTSRTDWSLLGVIIAAGVLLSCLVSSPIDAQVAGATLSGTVADESGSVILNAKVHIQNVATGVARDVPTDSAGFYSVPNLQPGIYDITVSATGFSTFEQNGVTLTVGAKQTLDMSMKVGQVTQKIEVTSEAPVVNLTSSAISNVIDETTVKELPLNGRDWTQLATLLPGVHAINTQSSIESHSSRSRRGWGNQLTDVGHRPTENNFRVDGISVNDISNSGPGSVLGVNLGVDAIQEFSVVSTNYSAEYGRTSGAVVNAVTKSGTNAFHGDAYGFFRNSALDAEPFFQPQGQPPAPFSRDQFGASAGYRLQKDKTFIFGDYEGIRQSLSSPNHDIVLSADAQKGILAGLNAPPVSSCPAGTTLFVPGQSNVCVDNLVVPYLQFFPLPNAGLSGASGSALDTGFYNVLGQSITSENYFTIKVDHVFSPKDSLSSSYFFDFAPFTVPDSYNYTIIGTITHRQMFSLEETHIFSPALVNSARFGFSREWSASQTPLTSLNPKAKDTSFGATPGQSVPIIEIPGIVTAMEGGFGASGATIDGWNSLQFYDDASFTKGTHDLKFGFAFERMQSNDSGGPYENGDFVFPSIQGFLTNQPLNVTLYDPALNVGYGVRQSLFAGYVQDDWRVRSNLTLNLGVRYEMTTLPTEAHDRFQYLRDFFGGIPVHANTSWVTNSTLRDFAPRVGFAWDPFKNGKTSVRAGFGIFDVVPLPVVGAPGPGYPFSVQPTIDLTNFPGTFPKGAAALLNFAGIDHTTTVSYKQPNPPRSYDMNWNMNVQRDLGNGAAMMIGYVGVHAIHQVVHPQDPNNVQPTFTAAGWLWPFPVGSGTVNNPNVGDIRSTVWNGSGFYNGLQGQLTKKGHGFDGQVSYTWGHCIDDGSSGAISDQFTNSLSTFFWIAPNIRSDHRGNCDYDERQVLSVNFIWDIPSPKSDNAFAQHILGGWQVGGILAAQTGTPFTLLIPGDPLGLLSTDPHDYPDRLTTAGCKNPVNPGNVNNYLKLNCFYDPVAPASFAPVCQPAAAGVVDPIPNTVTCMNLLGNNGRNQVYGPGLLGLDFSLFKDNRIKRISEDFNVQFRAEFFNVLNHPSFQSPLDSNALFNPDGTSVGGAGALDATTTSPREIQFGVKIVW